MDDEAPPVSTVICLGDSHINIFNSSLLKSAFPLTVFDVVMVLGATASGLDNPNSTTQAYRIFMAQAYRIFKERAFALRPGAAVIVMLGEVDTGFVIWWRANKYGEPIDKMLSWAVTNYTRFLGELQYAGKVIVVSTPLPTITDGTDWGTVANLRREVVATQLQRTQLTLQFNRAVKEFCRVRGIDYIDLDGESLDEDTKLVKEELLNKDRTDHHYEESVYARMLITHLRKIL